MAQYYRDRFGNVVQAQQYKDESDWPALLDFLGVHDQGEVALGAMQFRMTGERGWSETIRIPKGCFIVVDEEDKPFLMGIDEFVRGYQPMTDLPERGK